MAVTPFGPYAAGQTPLDADEAADLLPGHLATQAQLNEWEAANILEARRWAFAPRRPVVVGDLGRLLTEDTVRALHRRMFGKTWGWAGTFRRTEKNIGVAPERIATMLTDLCRDVGARLAHGGDPDDIGVWFHHRLVSIHPFANGNGRHARLMTDLLLAACGRAPFDWGAGDLVAEGEARARYLAALRSADARDHAPLRAFVRSGTPRP